MPVDRKWVSIPWAIIAAMIAMVIGVAVYTIWMSVDCGGGTDLKSEVNCSISWWAAFKKIAQIQVYVLTSVSVVLSAAVAVKEIFPNEAVRATTAVAASVAAGLLAAFKPDQAYQRFMEAEALARVAVVDYEHSPDERIRGNGKRLWEARLLGEAIIHEGSRYIKAPNIGGWQSETALSRPGGNGDGDAQPSPHGDQGLKAEQPVESKGT